MIPWRATGGAIEQSADWGDVRGEGEPGEGKEQVTIKERTGEGVKVARDTHDGGQVGSGDKGEYAA